MRRALIIIVVAVLGVFGWMGWLVAHPPIATDPTGDAIFVHAGGRGERIRTALDLFESGVAPILVISDPGVRSSFVPPGLCGSAADIICLTPTTIDTAGEARALGDLVATRAWDEVIVVTSDYHVRRASLLDQSCTEATVEPVAAVSRRGRSSISDAQVQEALGLAFSWLFQRC